MSRYRVQVLLVFLSGDDDQAVIQACQSLVIKAQKQGLQSPTYIASKLNPALIAETIKQLPKPWRLYLCGHGSFVNQTMGGYTPQRLASYLACCGLSYNLPAIISLIGCRMALGIDQSITRIEQTASDRSFTGTLHRLMGGKHHIQTPMFGRTMLVLVAPDTLPDVHNRGQKSTVPPGSRVGVISQSFSKVVFYWEGSMQRFRFMRAGEKYPISAN